MGVRDSWSISHCRRAARNALHSSKRASTKSLFSGCAAIAAANAPEHEGQGRHRGTLDDELALLVVHGVLHLLGHDHEVDEDAERMEALEQTLLQAHHR